MTTNVFDISAGILASDSRWSYRINDGYQATTAIVYVDNTEFDKLEFDPNFSLIFAGNSGLISAWKDWIRLPIKNLVPRPQVIDDFAMCLVRNKTKDVVFEHGQKIVDAAYRFAGTGAYPAHSCWTANKNAKKAIKSAQLTDHFSGGDVKYLDIVSAKHNFNPSGQLNSINAAILKRGMVMYTADNKPISIHDAAQNDPRVKDLVNKIASGGMSADAPSGLDKIVWTETDVKRLDAALEDCFGPLAK